MRQIKLWSIFLLIVTATGFSGCDDDDDGGGSGGYCSNSCEYAYDGVCDDGGPGSSYSVCDCGTDCDDCGTRYGCNGGGGGSTSIMVWTAQDHGCGSISVSIDGNYAGTITSYYSSGSPSCGSSGCVTVNVSAGSHTMSASCSGYTWGPSAYTVSSGSCQKIVLN